MLATTPYTGEAGLQGLLFEGFDIIVDAAQFARYADALRAARHALIAGDAVVRLTDGLYGLVV